MAVTHYEVLDVFSMSILYNIFTSVVVSVDFLYSMFLICNLYVLNLAIIIIIIIILFIERHIQRASRPNACIL